MNKPLNGSSFSQTGDWADFSGAFKMKAADLGLEKSHFYKKNV